MSRCRVVSTAISELRTPQGQMRDAVLLNLDCGHHVYRYYNHRHEYRHANCEWCVAARRDGVKYVRNPMTSRASVDEPDYVPESKSKPKRA